MNSSAVMFFSCDPRVPTKDYTSSLVPTDPFLRRKSCWHSAPTAARLQSTWDVRLKFFFLTAAKQSGTTVIVFHQNNTQLCQNCIIKIQWANRITNPQMINMITKCQQTTGICKLNPCVLCRTSGLSSYHILRLISRVEVKSQKHFL